MHSFRDPRTKMWLVCSAYKIGQPALYSRFHIVIPHLLLNTLHWLPIDKRIKFKTLLYIYKDLNDLSPVYLKDCIATHVPSKEGLRSSRDVTRLSIPKSSMRIGDGSFSVFGPTLWNSLPNTIRSSQTVSAFKRNLKLIYSSVFYLLLFVRKAH